MKENTYRYTSFTIKGKPQGKQRPRFNRFTGSVYTPSKTKSYEKLVKESYLKQSSFKSTKAIKMTIVVNVKVPERYSKKKQEQIKNFEIHPTKKPDLDNIVKSILDGLNRVAYTDDRQVTSIIAVKRFGFEDNVEVSIEEVGENCE